MKADEIRNQVASNMARSSFTVADLRLQPDPFGGWRLWLESENFRGIPAQERRAIVFAGLADEHFEWIDLVTSEEKVWAGAIPRNSDLEDLPLWPEALARAQTLTAPLDACFLSDLDEDLAAPLICTFYSLKGGVGRTTALGYTALILANKGFKVVCVDMDLEAPGLAAIFGRENAISEDMGVVHILDALDRGEDVELLDHLIRPDDALDLYILPAGLPGAEYTRLLRFTDPLSWYREEANPLRKMVSLLGDLALGPDLILFDARTGFNALNAPFLFELSDLAVIAFFPHPQAKRGTGELVRALLASNTQREANGRRLTPMPRFLVSPIPASKAPEVIKRYQHRALEWVAEWLSILGDGQRLAEGDLTHFVSYREMIATADNLLKSVDTWADYQQVAEWLLGFLRQPGEPIAPAANAQHKAVILESLRFQGDTAERQEQFLETFVETAVVLKALGSEVPLVLGRKGTGKTAIFRRLAETPNCSAVVVLAPAPLRKDRPWALGADGFKQVEEIICQRGADWRQIWSLCAAMAIHTEAEFEGLAPAPDSRLTKSADLAPKSELEFVEVIDKVLSLSGAGLLISDWLDRLDRAVLPPTLLLFDGLDTGFGNTEADRARRQVAVQGLFSFFIDRGEQFRHIRLKVLLREDIWQGLRFENKSHLFGRSVSLKWNEQVDFLRVVLKQAMRSEEFAHFAMPKESPTYQTMPIDHWPNEVVFKVWNLLVGERMKGGNTAFSRNWVWNRLADGNGDRTPRYLIQLFEEAVRWEGRESKVNPYDRSLIRPRGLIEALPKVSSRALSALKDEEFPQLEDLFDRLRSLRSSPVNAKEIEDLGDLVTLAREVGVLSVYEGTEDQAERYKVPDIYLAGLGMARKGQA
jgi:MinD-like ATPase involved in chromosome partitioning or flagellar assembly